VGGETRFDYTSFHHRPPSSPNPFYQRLFAMPRRPDIPDEGARTRDLASELRNRVRQQLPSYMVPSSFVLLKALPVTPSGKIDVRALPAPEAARAEAPGEFISPRTELEWIVARAWQELLHVPKVGVHDNFFDLGGHSLLIVRLQNKLREQLEVDVSLTDLFQYPTVGALAEALAKAGAARPASSPNASVSVG
jgi:acyl carrier protein